MSPTFGTSHRTPHAQHAHHNSSAPRTPSRTPRTPRGIVARSAAVQGLRARTRAMTTLATLTLLTACSGGDPALQPSDAPQATQASAPSVAPEPAVPVGLEWTEIPLPAGADPEADFYDFTGAGALFLAPYDTVTTLHMTNDGAAWQTLDLTASGLPTDVHLSAGTGGCGSGPAIDDSGDAVTIVYYQYADQGAPAGLLDRLWLVTVTPGDNAVVTVKAAADIGLETMPPPEGDDAFRTSCVTGFGDIGGQRVMVGEGQWWQPFQTSSDDAFTALEAADGTWSVHSTKASPFLGGDVTARIASVDMVGGNIVAVLYPTYEATGFAAWVSPDGRAWEKASITFPVPDAEIAIDGIVASDDALVVMTHTKDGTAGEATVWSTTDGVTWTSAVLGGGGYYDAGTLATTQGGFLASARYEANDKTDIYVWTSPDGVTWAPFGDGEKLDSSLLYAKGLASGLVANRSGTIEVSGNPWG